MQIPAFELERYFARHEFEAPYLLCCSDCESMTAGDLLRMSPGAQKDLENLWLGYTESRGHPLLRERIASLYEGIGVDQILVHAGAEEAIFNAMNVILKPGDHAIVHYPCYQSLLEIPKTIGCEVTLWKGAADSNWSLDLEYLEQKIRTNTRLVVLNCPHNPTGYLMRPDAFQHLVELSQKHGFVIFSDEVYRYLEYDLQDRLPALCETNDRGISLGVMSKSFGLAGLRIGWIATRNESLYNKLAGFKDFTTICNSAASEFLAITALKNKDRIIQRNLNLISSNLKILNQFFERHADRFVWNAPKAGPIAFPAIVQGHIDIFCKHLLGTTGVLLLPGTVYGNEYTKNFRIGFGRSNLTESLSRFEDYLRRQ
jgi:aspartate/methionine/tyrosine aminotransferase